MKPSYFFFILRDFSQILMVRRGDYLGLPFHHQIDGEKPEDVVASAFKGMADILHLPKLVLIPVGESESHDFHGQPISTKVFELAGIDHIAPMSDRASWYDEERDSLRFDVFVRTYALPRSRLS